MITNRRSTRARVRPNQPSRRSSRSRPHARRLSPDSGKQKPPTQAFAFFDTRVGRCGITWSDTGIAGVELPDSRDPATLARLARRHPELRPAPPPPYVRQTMAGITALLQGEKTDLSRVRLDMRDVRPFQRRVYEVVRRIAPGTTRTYGDIARSAGSPGAARAVGQALGRNPFAIIVPCHRVLSGDGRIGGFSAAGGIAVKLELLAIEAGGPCRPPALRSSGRSRAVDLRRATRHLRRADPALSRIMDQAGSFRLHMRRSSSVFAALAEAIVHQQLSGKAAVSIHARLRALFPRAHEDLRPRDILAASYRKLRSAGLSHSKVLSLQDLAQRAAAGTIPTLEQLEMMDDEAIIDSLVAVRGIGRWTVEMLLIFRLGRPDILPLDDYGIRKGYAITFRKRALPDRTQLAGHGDRWKPYRTVASWYLWRALELSRL